jgi:hypothetical protein
MLGYTPKYDISRKEARTMQAVSIVKGGARSFQDWEKTNESKAAQGSLR